MTEALERRQVWLYLVAIGAGMTIGGTAPGATAGWEALVWPVLGGLLYATFTQIPLVRLGRGVRDGRFLAALLLGNFVVMPAVVGLLSLLLPASPAIRLGVLLVLLVPCTDWFIGFTHQGGGDGGRALAAAPLLLIAQMLLLPVYIGLFMGPVAVDPAIGGHLLDAFLGLVAVPLVLAWGTERLARRRPWARRLVAGLGGLPVPLLALVMFLIAGSQVGLVLDLGGMLAPVLAVYAAYLVAAALAGKALGRAFGLAAPAARTLVFSLGTRNSFVVLPLALALPAGWRAAVVVIVFQSLVELFGMVAYLRWVPRYLIRPAP